MHSKTIYQKIIFHLKNEIDFHIISINLDRLLMLSYVISIQFLFETFFNIIKSK